MSLQKKKFFEHVLSLLYPKDVKCMFCAEELNDKAYNKTCEICYASLPFIKNSCLRCSAPMNENQSGVCLKCKRNNYYFKTARSIFIYESPVLQIVHAIKYGGKRYLIEPVVKYLVDSYSTWNVFPNIITCVPMFYKKEKERGYNQSQLIAKSLAEKICVPFEELCIKIKDTSSQTNFNTKERMENIKDSFAFNTKFKRLIKNKIICIVDDVITTGATTNEISKILIENGAKECHVLTFAHTNLPQINIEN